MKRLLFAALLCLPTPVFAETKTLECSDWGAFAKAIMQGRQQQVAMSKLMDIAENPELDADKDVLRTIVTGAYEQPAWETGENQARAVAEYRNEIELACYNSAGGRQ